MPKDYARRAPRKAAQRKTRSASQKANAPRFSGPSFGGGICCGAVVVLGLIYGPSLLPALSDAATPEAAAAATTRPALTYEFMHRLPIDEVVTNVTPYEPPAPEDAAEQTDVKQLAAASQAPVATSATAASTGAAEQSAASVAGAVTVANAASAVASASDSANRTPMSYLLQAASFRDRDEANAMRARLLLEGLNASINEAPQASGDWHRVMVGPFASERELQGALTQLRAKDIAAVRVPQPPG